jgi:hypothetical protein
VATDQALPEVDPGIAQLKAFLAAVRLARELMYLIEVTARRGHGGAPFLILGP